MGGWAGSAGLIWYVLKMRKKIDAGAEFFQTQAIHDPDVFKRPMDRIADIEASVTVGIVPLKSAGIAKYMTADVAAVNVPDDMIERISEAPKEDFKQASLEMS